MRGTTTAVRPVTAGVVGALLVVLLTREHRADRPQQPGQADQQQRLHRARRPAWLAFGYLVVVGRAVACSSYVWLLAHAPVSLVTTHAYVNPAVAVALGALLLAEPLSAPVLVGGG